MKTFITLLALVIVPTFANANKCREPQKVVLSRCVKAPTQLTDDQIVASLLRSEGTENGRKVVVYKTPRVMYYFAEEYDKVLFLIPMEDGTIYEKELMERVSGEWMSFHPVEKTQRDCNGANCQELIRHMHEAYTENYKYRYTGQACQ
jgi:hypothetical protein